MDNYKRMKQEESKLGTAKRKGKVSPFTGTYYCHWIKLPMGGQSGENRQMSIIFAQK